MNEGETSLGGGERLAYLRDRRSIYRIRRENSRDKLFPRYYALR